MAVFRKKKPARGPYDKIVKQAQELIRQELAPIRAQNDKITEYVRQIWNNVEKREADEDEAQG